MNGVDTVAVISSVGPAREKWTWSGTTANIVSALEAAGVSVTDHAISVGKPRRLAYEAAGRLLGLGSRQLERVGPWRQYLRRAASAAVSATAAQTVLHFGSSHLPLITSRPGQRHYLVTDYNLHLLLTKGVLAQQAGGRYKRKVLATERQIAAQIDGIFTISDFVREDWLEEYGLPEAKVTTIGTGLGQPVMLDGQVKDYAAGHLLYIGRHSFDIKGGELLLPAFEHALRQRPDLKLVIIGDAADPKLARHLPAVRANPAIEFHQSGTPHFVDLVRGAALYVAPAPAEPWGLVYLETMMCETPVLALDRNAMRQLTDGGRLGFLVREASPAAVGDAIVAAMRNPERLRRMGEEGRAFVEANFTWHNVARTMIDRIAADGRRT